MRRHKITFQILLWGSLAILTPTAPILTFLWGDRDHFIPTLCICLLFLLLCIYKIHSLLSSRRYYHPGELTLRDLDGISGIDFEKLTCDILASNGFELAENTQASADFGVDVLAYKDGISFAIQCKRYQSDVGIEAVQQVYAGRAYYECHVAMVLTNQYFTPSAQKLANKIGVVLWDRDMLRMLLQ